MLIKKKIVNQLFDLKANSHSSAQHSTIINDYRVMRLLGENCCFICLLKPFVIVLAGLLYCPTVDTADVEAVEETDNQFNRSGANTSTKKIKL